MLPVHITSGRLASVLCTGAVRDTGDALLPVLVFAAMCQLVVANEAAPDHVGENQSIGIDPRALSIVVVEWVMWLAIRDDFRNWLIHAA